MALQISDISISTALQIGAVVVGVSLAWGTMRAQDAWQDSRIAAIEKQLDDAKKERNERIGWMMRDGWQRRREQPGPLVTPAAAVPVCNLTAPRG